MDELDIVKAKRDLSKYVLKDCIGTIVTVYDKPKLAYEVEFVDSDGETIDILTVEKVDLLLKQKIAK